MWRYRRGAAPSRSTYVRLVFETARCLVIREACMMPRGALLMCSWCHCTLALHLLLE
jgi:hypothetical protein